jgi:hypothetical protein
MLLRILNRISVHMSASKLRLSPSPKCAVFARSGHYLSDHPYFLVYLTLDML